MAPVPFEWVAIVVGALVLALSWAISMWRLGAKKGESKLSKKDKEIEKLNGRIDQIRLEQIAEERKGREYDRTHIGKLEGLLKELRGEE